jgi:Fic family protein
MARKKTDITPQILEFIRANPRCSSKEIYEGIGSEPGYATVKRSIQQLLEEKLIKLSGKGKGTKYETSPGYDFIRTINVDRYFQQEIDDRRIQSSFNHLLISELIPSSFLFTDEEVHTLTSLQNQYKEKSSKLTPNEYKKELERLAIDLSWKSSQIEGNTYSLLETETLLKDKHTASGKTKEEAIMLLDHKEALDFIIAQPNYIQPLTLSGIEDIHSILIKDLEVDRNIRKRTVGISGTNYRPLDNEFQIREAMEGMCILINSQENVFAKALLVLLLISYIQPFADGNKRTARIISNAILINNNYCPISFRTVDAIDYKKAILIFYEQNNISAFKKIFIEQFEFAVKTYF